MPNENQRMSTDTAVLASDVAQEAGVDDGDDRSAWDVADWKGHCRTVEGRLAYAEGQLEALHRELTFFEARSKQLFRVLSAMNEFVGDGRLELKFKSQAKGGRPRTQALRNVGLLLRADHLGRGGPRKMAREEFERQGVRPTRSELDRKAKTIGNLVANLKKAAKQVP